MPNIWKILYQFGLCYYRPNSMKLTVLVRKTLTMVDWCIRHVVAIHDWRGWVGVTCHRVDVEDLKLGQYKPYK